VFICVALPSLPGNGSVKCIPPFDVRQRLGKHVPAAVNTRNNRIVGGVRFIDGPCRIKEKSMSLCITLSLLGNGLVAVTRNFSLCGLRRINGKETIISSQNLLF
jgi:hypothetical protein